MKATLNQINSCNDIHEVLAHANLNFIPEKHPVMTTSGIDCPENCAVVRNDTNEVLSVMGKDYTPLSIHQTFAIADVLKDKYGMRFHRLVNIDNGRRIHLEMRGDLIRVGNDAVRKTLIIRDAFDGSWKQVIMFGAFRLVCANGLYVGKLEHKTMIRHTKHAQDRFNEALTVWAKAENAFEEIENKFQVLGNKIVDRLQVERFLDQLIGEVTEKTSTRKKNQRADIERLFQYGRGNSGKTAWDLYNGVSEYYQHEVNASNPDQRLASAIAGTGFDQVTKAFDLAMAI